MVTRWYQERKNEYYYKKAKQVGYRARSAFKLIQIQYRFHIIKRGDIVVDLGAAPGGWSQVAYELVGKDGLVISVDISTMKPLDGVVFIQGDMTDPSTLERIKDELPDGKADVIISDMSPDISGSYSVDQARSVYLCEQAFKCAIQILKNHGNFICKIFEGEDTKIFLDNLKKYFKLIKLHSPEASRKSSSEIYIICKDFQV
ncbi:MAG: RlmE family RNA methyltransferase [Candidatus Thermoplasmatota archaeon]